MHTQTYTCMHECTYTHTHTHKLIPPCDTRRRERVGALYSALFFLLIILHQQNIPSISLSCTTEYNSLVSSVVIVVLNQEIHLHKPQNTTACLTSTSSQQLYILDRLFSTSAGQSWNQNIDLVHHPPNSCRSDPRSFSTSAGQSQNKKVLPSQLLTHAHTSIHTHTHTHTQAFMDAHIMRAHVHARMHMYARTHIHTHTYTHIYTHTHTHTYTHTYTHIHTHTPGA